MAIGPVTFYDSFSRSGTNDWGSSDSGDTWNNESTNHDISSAGGYAYVYVPAGDSTRIVYVGAITDDQQTQEALFKVRWNTTNLTDHGPIVRRQDSNNYYYVRIQDYYHQVAINVMHDGTAIELNRATGVTLEKDTYYWVRFRSDTTNLYLKIWAETAAEPGSWTLTSGLYDGPSPPGGGDFGYYTKGTDTTYTVRLDTAYWYTLEDSEPNFPVTENFSRNVDKGWGRSDSGHQWEGWFASDPILQGVVKGDVFDSGYARYAAPDTATYYGMIGPSATDMEATGQFYVDSTSGSPEARLFVRGTLDTDSTPYVMDGYMARLIWGSTTFQVMRADDGSFTTLGSTVVLSETPTSGQIWNIKIQIIGTTIKAKAWRDGTSEPAFLITTSSSVYTSGRTVVGLRGGTGTVNHRVYQVTATNDPSAGTDTTFLTTGTLSTSSVTDDGFSITATYTNDTNDNSTCVIQYRRSGLSTWQDTTESTDRANHRFTATVTGLEPGELYEVRATYSDSNGTTGTNPKTTSVTTLLKGLDTGTVTLTPTMTEIGVVATYTNDSDDDSTATVEYRLTPAGSFSAPAAMTADHANKQFTANLTGLSPDSGYEVRVTYSDADELRGSNPLTVSTTTLGLAVQLDSINTVVSETSAIVTVEYSYDTNEDSELAVQYKSIREQLWSTVVPQAISADRANTRFRFLLTGLTPNLSYEIEATVSDPDGVVAGTSDTITATFTTDGAVADPDKRGKHYVFKIYDHLGNYKGTWPDAPEPEFSWHENGGVSDMTVVLPRTLAQLNEDRTIDFGYRVDVWALDGSSNGFGANLLLDNDMDLGSWTLGTSWEVEAGGGPDDSTALKFSSSSATSFETLSETIDLASVVPVVVQGIAKARGGKIRMDVLAYDSGDVLLESSDETAETIGNRWQNLIVEYTPPIGTAYIRVRLQNIGKGTMRFDKCKVYAKEVLIYRGRIETYAPRLSQQGENVRIEVLGLVSQLTDQYTRFLQYVTTQPTKDVNAGLPFSPPDDPSNMLKDIIDQAQAEDPLFDLYYTSDSIKLTGTTVEYTFRDQQLRTSFDKIRNLCPSGWHYYIEPDGKVWLRGPEHAVTHKLRLNVEVMEFENDKTVRNLKNYIHVKGRQDEDGTEADGFGSIAYITFDQASIDRYGLRVLKIRDANIKDPETAELVGEGRLEEYLEPEQRARAQIPDEKDLRYAGGSLRGYNIEAFRPGDFVQIKDPTSGANRYFWDQFEWDDGRWDSKTTKAIPDDVPIKTIQYHGTHVIIELSERQPSQIGEFAKLHRWLISQEADTSD